MRVRQRLGGGACAAGHRVGQMFNVMASCFNDIQNSGEVVVFQAVFQQRGWWAVEDVSAQLGDGDVQRGRGWCSHDHRGGWGRRGRWVQLSRTNQWKSWQITPCNKFFLD